MNVFLDKDELIFANIAYRKIGDIPKSEKIVLPDAAGFIHDDIGRLQIRTPEIGEKPFNNTELLRALGNQGIRALRPEVTKENITEAAKIGAFVVTEAIKEQEIPVSRSGLRAVTQNMFIGMVSLGAQEVGSHKDQLTELDRILNPNPRLSWFKRRQPE